MATKISDLEQRILQLEQGQNQLKSRQEWLERVFATYGIKGLWLSPTKAAPLLGVSEDRIEDEIKRAERMRQAKRRGDAVYGTHYRNIQTIESKNATWQVNVSKFDELFAIPPDQRKV
jgi:hypothetical protein